MILRKLVSLSIVVASLAFLAAPACAADVVGRVLLSAGNAFAIRDGREVRLAYNSPIESRDILRTGEASSLQVRFSDSSIMSLRENSELAIEEYRFGGSADGSEKGFYKLVKGGLRAVTGLIGRTRHENFRIDSVTATIGIRGTDFAIRECQADCGANIKPGLYGSVLGQSSGTNRVAVTNKAGEFVFGKDEHFFVADPNTRPQPLLEPPSFVSVKPQGKGDAAKQSGSGTEQASKGSGAQSESRPAAAAAPAPVDVGLVQSKPYQATEQFNPSGQPAVFAIGTNGLALAFGYSGVGIADGTFSSSLSVSGSGASQTLTSFSGSLEQGLSFITGAQGPQGSDMTGYSSAVNGYFGRWKDGTLNISEPGSPTLAITPGTGVHYIYGFDITPPAVFAPKTGVFEFNRIAGTTPTDGNGNIASSYSFGPMIVEFQHLKGAIGNSSWTIAGVTHQFKDIELDLYNNGRGIGFEGFNWYGQGSNSGLCTGGACGSGSFALAFVSGGFAGASGDHAGVAFGTTSAAGSTASVQLYQCPTCASTNVGLPLAGLATAFAGQSPGYDVAMAEVAVKASPYMVLSGSNLTAINNFSDSMTVSPGSNVNTGTLGPINGAFGRWNGGTVTGIGWTGMPVSTPFVPGTGIHWLYGDLAFPEAVFTRTGSVNFLSVAGTLPTDSAGGVGSWLGGNLAVNFTSLSATMNASWTTPSSPSPYTWTLTNTPLELHREAVEVRVTTPNQQPLASHASTSCSGGGPACSGTINFVNVRGVFMGSTGNHVGTSISTYQGGAVNKGTATVQVFSCTGQPGC